MTAKRGPQETTRNVEKFKLIKKRPEHLKTEPQNTNRKHGSKVEDTDDEENWMEYTRAEGQRPQENQPGQEDEDEQGQPQPESLTDEDEPGPAGINREVGWLKDKLTVQPEHRKRQSKPTKRLLDELEQERNQENELEREVSETKETRSCTPGGSPGTVVPEEEDLQGQLELEQPRAAPAFSPAPVPHRGPSGQAQGAGPLTPGERENEDDQDEDVLDDEGGDNANSLHS